MIAPKTSFAAFLGLFIVVANTQPIRDCTVTGQRNPSIQLPMSSRHQKDVRITDDQSIEIAWIFTGGQNLQASVVMTWATGVGGGSEHCSQEIDITNDWKDGSINGKGYYSNNCDIYGIFDGVPSTDISQDEPPVATYGAGHGQNFGWVLSPGHTTVFPYPPFVRYNFSVTWPK